MFPLIVSLTFVLIIVASVAFHFWSPWWWTPVASNWGGMDDTILLTFWVTGVVFIAICLFMAYCIWRYRYRKDRKVEYKPEDKKLEFHLTWLTTLGVIAMLAPGLVVWHKYVTVPEDALNVEVVAYQWDWKYRLPGKDGILGKTEIKFINDENPFGLNLDDPNGKDDLLVDNGDLHLQIDKPVKLLLRSFDVIHNFYVPQFRGKMDMLPGHVTFYWLTPIRTGNKGDLGPGSVQWMTAAGGIIHSEMPIMKEGKLHGFQLWVNMPARLKMGRPSYQNIEPKEIPEFKDQEKKIKIIAGKYQDKTGPAKGISVDPIYIDVELEKDKIFNFIIPSSHNAFVYLVTGKIKIGNNKHDQLQNSNLICLQNGSDLKISAIKKSKFLVIAGKPIGEPIARGGPFVMNTKEEILKAVQDYHSGNFVQK